MLLSKTLRSSTLKLAFIYVIVFSSAIFAVSGLCILVYCRLYFRKIADRSHHGGASALLIKAYEQRGPDGLDRC